MRDETKRRIKGYTKALPLVKEKVFISLLLLLIATSISVVSSFAWITLSQSPEVSSIATTLSSNGALEIALAPNDGSLPSDADVDESIGINTDITVSNLQWGNLINISDARYGIDDLILRPSQLNSASLSTSPLWGAVYGADGRITQLNTKYTYSKWVESENDFMVSSDRGVRAISSYFTKTSDASALEYEKVYQAVLNAHNAVNTYYTSNVAIASSMNAMGSAVGTYLQSKLNAEGYGTSSDTNLPLSTSQVQDLLNILTRLQSAMEKECDALVALANLQQYKYAKENEVIYSEIDWNSLVSGQNIYDSTGTQHKTTPTKPTEAISIKGLKTFIADMSTVASDVTLLTQLYEKSNSGQTVYSNDIDTPVKHICDPNKVLLDGDAVSALMTKIKNSPLSALSYTSGDHLVKISGGFLGNFEQMAIDTSYRLKESKTDKNNAASVKATAKMVITLNINMTGHLCTSATGNSYFMDDFGQISSDINTGDKFAEDTYGMAVDFWIRCNAESTYLTLEGALVTDTDGTILRYDGVNRIWGSTGNNALTINSTTQGGGSCYIYYTDSPEEMSKSLELLKSMKVAFVDQEGTLLATAAMDTENYWALTGRVVVPLVISNTQSLPYTYLNDLGEEETRYSIKHIKLDENHLITAIVYLDGATLSNTQVLSAGDIQGQLNLQFGSSQQLQTVGDSKLLTEERYATASVSKNTFNYDTATGPTDLTTTVTVNVEGASPSSVTAFFSRAVNDKQGQREEEMKFVKQADGTWKADYAFKLPGTYYLRFIRLDRVDYPLEEQPIVNVEGFALSSVEWGEGLLSERTYYSSNNTFEETVAVKFVTTNAERMPKSVSARFIRSDGNAVNINTTYNARNGKWEGKGTFNASGEYTLSYLLLNGDYYYDISEYSKKLDLYLGLTTSVYNHNSPLTEEYDSSTPDKVYERNVQVKIFDNVGNELRNLNDVTIYYSSGSSLQGKDATLTFNEITDFYEGTLPFVKAGRYAFSALQVGGNILNVAKESPVYAIAPPEPPVYQTSSESEFNGSNIQFNTLKSNAKLGPIVITDSAAVEISAVVYNNKTGKYYEITKSNTQNEQATMYYSELEGGYWTINLPTYSDTDNNQDGTWSVIAFKIWECFDGSDSIDNYRTEDRPLIWLGRSNEASSYSRNNNLVVDKTFDFSKISTTVSCTANVTMEAGTTELGSETAEFMSIYEVKDLGMKVRVTDDDGRIIPQESISEVELSISYVGNTNIEEYGYEVSSSANKNYTIKMVQQEDGSWIPDSESNYKWQYAGEYKVNSLNVTVAGQAKEFAAGENGVPEMYTIKSIGPTPADLEIQKAVQGNLVFGKTADEVTGEFLASYSPSVTTVMTWKSNKLDINEQQHAKVPGMSVKIEYDYKDGNSAPYGDYSWEGVSPYVHYEDLIENPTTNGLTYEFKAAKSKVLLAGNYEVKGTLYWLENGEEKRTSIGELKDVVVYSVDPSITVTNVSPSPDVEFDVNTNGNGDQSYLVSNTSTFKAKNRFGDYYAAVYIQYEPFNSTNNSATYDGVTLSTHSGEFSNYTLPTITIIGSNIGSKGATFNIVGNGVTSVNLLDNNQTNIEIGRINSNNQSFAEQYEESGTCSSGSGTFTYKAENAYILGTIKIDSISTTSETVVYSRKLNNAVIISETNSKAPKILFSNIGGLNISAIDANTGLGVSNESMIDGMTSLTLSAKANDGYFNPRLTKPNNAINWNIISEGIEESVYTCEMPFEDMTLTGNVEEYPTLSWQPSTKYEVISSLINNSRVKPGTNVTLKLVADEKYYNPKFNKPNSIEWSANESELESSYSFVMPDNDVYIESNELDNKYQITWLDGTPSFQVTDRNLNIVISSGEYIIPDHTVQVVLTGYKPILISPVAENINSSSMNSTYNFVMPHNDVILVGEVEPQPRLSFDQKYATVSITSNGFDLHTESSTYTEIQYNNLVNLTLSPKEGYFAPRLGSISGVNVMTVSQNNSSSTYTFNMPDHDIDISQLITATGYTVSYNPNGGTTSTSSNTYDGEGITFPNPTRSGYKFEGWYTATSGGTKVSEPYTPSTNSTIYAQWTPYKVTYNLNGGSGTTAVVTYNDSPITYPNTNPTRTGYKFNGWYTASSGGTKVDSITPSSDTILYAQWQGYTVKYNANGGSVSPSSHTYSGKPISFPNPTRSGYNFEGWYTATSGGTPVDTNYTPTGDITLYAHWTKQSGGSCVADGTIVALADGTYKKIEDITMNDEVLVFNHETGLLDSAKISFIENDGFDYYDVINLKWSNGQTSRVIYEHGFFDLDLMKYVYIHEDDYQLYIGHSFYDVNGNSVILEDAFVTNEYCGCYSFPSEYHLNFFMEDMLSMPGGITGMFNIFEYDDNLKYNEEKMNEDLALYGLFDYSEVSQYVNKETFDKYPTKYVNVSIGKGLMTKETLNYYIERYAIRYEDNPLADHPVLSWIVENNVLDVDTCLQLFDFLIY